MVKSVIKGVIVMAKIVFSDLPMKKELHSFCYVAEGNRNIQYDGKVVFPVNAVLAKILTKDEKVKVVILSKEDREGNSAVNLQKFKEELDVIKKDIGAKIEYKNIVTPFVETRDIHEGLLRSVIGELEEGAEIIGDITYGPKTLPLILFTALNFAEKFFGCKIENIVYGKVNFVDDGSGTGKTKPINPVLYDLTPLYFLNAVTNVMECKNAEEAVRSLDFLLKM